MAVHMQDYFHHRDGVSNGGNRYATVLSYLSDVEEGGETVRWPEHKDQLTRLHALFGPTEGWQICAGMCVWARQQQLVCHGCCTSWSCSGC